MTSFNLMTFLKGSPCKCSYTWELELHSKNSGKKGKQNSVYSAGLIQKRFASACIKESGSYRELDHGL